MILNPEEKVCREDQNEEGNCAVDISEWKSEQGSK